MRAQRHGMCNAYGVTMDQPITRADVEPDLADRMAKALHVSGISVNQMAELLMVHRNTVGGWLNRRAEPGLHTLLLWAHLTGVPYAWLDTGEWLDTSKTAAPAPAQTALSRARKYQGRRQTRLAILPDLPACAHPRVYGAGPREGQCTVCGERADS